MLYDAALGEEEPPAWAGVQNDGIVRPVAYADLQERYPDLDPEIVAGLLRRCEVACIAAGTKVGKSFLAGNLAWAMATGCEWLGFKTTPGGVLIIDNELRPSTLAHRLERIQSKMMVTPEHPIDVMSLRGRICDVNALDRHLSEIDIGRYQLVIIDALYRTLPAGASENDNAHITGIFNQLDRYASKLDAAILLIHHTSKGNQADKALTDVGAGAGALSRAPDTYIVVREHEQDGCCVMEARCRSMKSPGPLTIRFDWPLWEATSDEAILKRAKSAGDEKRKQQNDATDQAVLKHLRSTPRGLTSSELRGLTKFGPSRVNNALERLQEAEKVTFKRGRSRKTGHRIERYFAASN